MTNQLEGRLWLSRSDHSFLGLGRIALLEAIGETGSISKAAKSMKMSYKSAWDSVDAMNNLSDYPLVERASGGKGGGGTCLTTYAKSIIDTFHLVNEEHARFLHNLSVRLNESDGHLRLLNDLSRQLSARNQLRGTIVSIETSTIQSHIMVQLASGHEMMATITNDSLQDLDLRVGIEVYLLFKASAVTLVPLEESDSNKENCFLGTVERMSHDEARTEVVVKLDQQTTLCTTVSNETATRLGLEQNMPISAQVNPNQIMIGIE